jgi:hypothetical protein
MQNGISYDSSTDGQFFAIYARASVSLKISTRHPPLRRRSSSLPKACVGALCVVMYTMCGVGTDVLGKQSAVVTIGYPLSAFGHRIVLHITAVTTTARNTMYNSRLVSIAGRVLVAIAMSTHPDAGAALGTAGHTAAGRSKTCNLSFSTQSSGAGRWGGFSGWRKRTALVSRLVCEERGHSELTNCRTYAPTSS